MMTAYGNISVTHQVNFLILITALRLKLVISQNETNLKSQLTIIIIIKQWFLYLYKIFFQSDFCEGQCNGKSFFLSLHNLIFKLKNVMQDFKQYFVSACLQCEYKLVCQHMLNLLLSTNTHLRENENYPCAHGQTITSEPSMWTKVCASQFNLSVNERFL